MLFLGTPVDPNKEEMKSDKRKLRIIFKSMDIMGLGFEQRKNACCSVIINTIFLVGSLLSTGYTLYRAYTATNMVWSITMIVWRLSYLVMLAATWFYCTRRKQLYDIKTELSDAANAEVSLCDVAVLTVAWIHAIFSMTLIGRKGFTSDRISVSNLLDTLIRCLFIGQHAIGEYLLYLCDTHLLLFYDISCRGLTRMFKGLNVEFSNNSSSSSEKRISPFTRCYSQLWKFVKSLYDAYSSIIFFCSINITVKLITNINLVISHLNSEPADVKLIMSTGILYSLYIFAKVCLSSSRLCDAANQTLRAMYEQSLGYKEYISRERVYRFFVLNKHDPPQLTAWKTFPVNRNLLLTVLSIALTYLIVIFQLNG